MQRDEGFPTGSVPGPDDVSFPTSAPPPPPASPTPPAAPTPPPPSDWAPPPPPALPPPSAPVGDSYLPVGDSYWQPRSAASPASPPPPARSRSRRPLTALAAMVVVAAAVAGVIVFATGAKSAEATVIDAVTSTLADKTAAVQMNGSFDYASSNASITGTGSIDFTQDALDMNLTVDDGGNQVPVQALYLGGTVYENLAGLGQLLPGKSWLSIDLGSSGQASSDTPGGLSSAGNPTDFVKVLQARGETVTPLGGSTVDGAAVQGYRVVISESALKAEVASDHLPSWIEGGAGVAQSGVTARVYVDDSGMLRRFATSLGADIPQIGPISVDETLDFSDYGAPFSASPPPAAEIASFQQFLQAAESAVGSQTSS